MKRKSNTPSGWFAPKGSVSNNSFWIGYICFFLFFGAILCFVFGMVEYSNELMSYTDFQGFLTVAIVMVVLGVVLIFIARIESNKAVEQRNRIYALEKEALEYDEKTGILNLYKRAPSLKIFFRLVDNRDVSLGKTEEKLHIGAVSVGGVTTGGTYVTGGDYVTVVGKKNGTAILAYRNHPIMGIKLSDELYEALKHSEIFSYCDEDKIIRTCGGYKTGSSFDPSKVYNINFYSRGKLENIYSWITSDL